MVDNKNPSVPVSKNEPPRRSLTLEQALLAPLDSILKAQLHSARSFLNMLLQLGYPHDWRNDDGNSGDVESTEGGGEASASKPPSDEPYHMEFSFRDEDNNKQILSVPSLALVRILPLAVDSASFELEMAA
ncbi:MAG: hypothetical protein ACI9Y1_000676 [Lentisphaeria bacterium]|jgi:hypothetical protein